MRLTHIQIISFITGFIVLNIAFCGCLNSEKIEYLDGNIGKIQISGAINKIQIKDYHLETLLFNNTSSSINSKSGIHYNEDIIGYRIKGNITSIADEQIERVLITFRFFGGISRGVFVLYSITQETFYVDPDESWTYNIRFERNDPKFSKISFFDIQIKTEEVTTE